MVKTVTAKQLAEMREQGYRADSGSALEEIGVIDQADAPEVLGYVVDSQTGRRAEMGSAEASEIIGNVVRDALRGVAGESKPHKIPSAARFGSLAFLEAPDLEEIALRLIRSTLDFEQLADLRIAYRWKATGGKSGGRPRIGGIAKVSGQSLAFLPEHGPELLVWLSADTLRDAFASSLQVEASLYEQLAHVEWSDDNEETGESSWTLVGPDVVCHRATLERYGPFTRTLALAKPAFQQPGLFDVPSEANG